MKRSAAQRASHLFPEAVQYWIHPAKANNRTTYNRADVPSRIEAVRIARARWVTNGTGRPKSASNTAGAGACASARASEYGYMNPLVSIRIVGRARP